MYKLLQILQIASNTKYTQNCKVTSSIWKTIAWKVTMQSRDLDPLLKTDKPFPLPYKLQLFFNK